ncbi:hypothetical protein ACHAQJ_001543 [Trichoderma viride]
MHLHSLLSLTTVVLVGHSFASIVPFFWNKDSISEKPIPLRSMDEITKAAVNVTNAYPFNCLCKDQYTHDNTEPCFPFQKVSRLVPGVCYTMRIPSRALRVWDTRLSVSKYVECRVYRHEDCMGISSMPVVFEDNFQCRDMLEKNDEEPTVESTFMSFMCTDLVRAQAWPEDQGA